MTAETVTRTKVRCPLGNPAHASEKNIAPAAPPGRHALGALHGNVDRDLVVGSTPPSSCASCGWTWPPSLSGSAPARSWEGLHDVCDANEYLMDADENLGLDWDGSDASNVFRNDAIYMAERALSRRRPARSAARAWPRVIWPRCTPRWTSRSPRARPAVAPCTRRALRRVAGGVMAPIGYTDKQAERLTGCRSGRPHGHATSSWHCTGSSATTTT